MCRRPQFTPLQHCISPFLEKSSDKLPFIKPSKQKLQAIELHKPAYDPTSWYNLLSTFLNLKLPILYKSFWCLQHRKPSIKHSCNLTISSVLIPNGNFGQLFSTTSTPLPSMCDLLFFECQLLIASPATVLNQFNKFLSASEKMYVSQNS